MLQPQPAALSQEFLSRSPQPGLIGTLWQRCAVDFIEHPLRRGVPLLQHTINKMSCLLAEDFISTASSRDSLDDLLMSITERTRPLVTALATAREHIGRGLGILDFQCIDSAVMQCCISGQDDP